MVACFFFPAFWAAQSRRRLLSNMTDIGFQHGYRSRTKSDPDSRQRLTGKPALSPVTMVSKYSTSSLIGFSKHSFRNRLPDIQQAAAPEEPRQGNRTASAGLWRCEMRPVKTSFGFKTFTKLVLVATPRRFSQVDYKCV